MISISSRNERRTLKKAGLDLALAEAGQEIGDCFDVSTLRREDFLFHTGKDEQSDVYQVSYFSSVVGIFRVENTQIPILILLQILL